MLLSILIVFFKESKIKIFYSQEMYLIHENLKTIIFNDNFQNINFLINILKTLISNTHI